MGRGDRERLGRVSVMVPPDVRSARPTDVGLADGASRTKVYEAVMRRGWQAIQQDARERRQLEVYEAYARDPERQKVARADQQEIVRSRVV